MMIKLILFSLGSSYARLFAKLGARVVVNDFDKANADAVVTEIINSGGQAVANCDSVTDGAANIIQTAIKHFGRIDVLVNNAGFLLDQTFLKMTEDKWDAVLTVHLEGTYSMTKAAWPYFV
jgi:multifunctional beta-oxidation protein